MKDDRIGDLRRIGDQAIEPGKVYVLRGEFNGWEPGRGERVYIETLHVVSSYAGGEVRGYRRDRGETSWKLRRPATPESWPEMDAAVATLVGESVNGAKPGQDRGQLALALGTLEVTP